MPISQERCTAPSQWLLCCLLLLPWLARGDLVQPIGPVTDGLADPAAATIRRVLEEERHPHLHWSRITDVRKRLDDFYRRDAYRPVWSSDGTLRAQVPALITALAAADAEGLDVADYDVALLEKWSALIGPETAPDERALFDTALTIAAARYASSLYQGRVDPQGLGHGLNVERAKPFDVTGLLDRLLEGDDPSLVFAALAPKSPLYRIFKDALRDYRTTSTRDTDRRLTLTGKLTPGDRNAEVPKLRAILSASGEPGLTVAPPEEDVYDPLLVEAVKRFQHRHGLNADGVIGKGTLDRLQVSDAERAVQIQLGMERLRWLPESAAGPYLLVNVPSFELLGFDEGLGTHTPALSMRVIVGQAIDGRRTPIFHADMSYVVFRPHWNLPYKIATKEMLPGALRNPGYLARHNIEIVSGFGANAAVYAPTPDNLRRVSSGALKLRQKPGPKNALGLVKFAFPNDDAVYLHSTPNQHLFSRDRRDFSHGCIRVADPVGLAEWVLKENTGWNRQRIVQAMNGGKPRTVHLATPLPVYILYSTVWVDETGRIIFFKDIYGHDAALRSLLAKGFPHRSERPDGVAEATSKGRAEGMATR